MFLLSYTSNEAPENAPDQDLSQDDRKYLSELHARMKIAMQQSLTGDERAKLWKIRGESLQRANLAVGGKRKESEGGQVMRLDGPKRQKRVEQKRVYIGEKIGKQELDHHQEEEQNNHQEEEQDNHQEEELRKDATKINGEGLIE